MKRTAFAPLPAEMPDTEWNDKWLDRIANCSRSCAGTMEARRLRSNEVPLVLGSLAVALADHTEVPLERVLEMINQAARQLVIATPEAPAPIPS